MGVVCSPAPPEPMIVSENIFCTCVRAGFLIKSGCLATVLPERAASGQWENLPYSFDILVRLDGSQNRKGGKGRGVGKKAGNEKKNLAANPKFSCWKMMLFLNPLSSYTYSCRTITTWEVLLFARGESDMLQAKMARRGGIAFGGPEFGLCCVRSTIRVPNSGPILCNDTHSWNNVVTDFWNPLNTRFSSPSLSFPPSSRLCALLKCSTGEMRGERLLFGDSFLAHWCLGYTCTFS